MTDDVAEFWRGHALLVEALNENTLTSKGPPAAEVNRVQEPDLSTPAAGVVYFIEALGTGRLKIGWTRRPVGARLRQLQTAMPFELVVRATIPGTMMDERALHRRFASLRALATAEWFHLRDELAAHVTSLMPRKPRRR